MDSIEDIAQSADQRAAHCRSTNDAVGEQIARRCAQRIRAAASPAEAAAIEREFYGGSGAGAGPVVAPRGCLGGLFGGLFGQSRSTGWTTTRSSYNTFGYNEGVGYAMFDGLLRSGGSSSWRNHNPGQVPYDEWSIAQGAIGSDHGMAVFPSYEAGRRAFAEKLTTAPGDQSVNDIVRNSYLANIPDDALKSAGIDPHTPAAQLSPEQLNHLMDSVENSKAFEPGQVVSRDSSDAPAWASDLFVADAAWNAEPAVSVDSGSSSGETGSGSDNS
jgi:hypothetical protein